MTFSILLAAAVSATPPANPPAVPAPPFEDASSLDDQSLGKATAREDLNQLAVNTQTASVSSNSVSGVTNTGTATFADQAFQNVSGLTVINANTGNNVAINGAITVNLTISPPQ